MAKIQTGSLINSIRGKLGSEIFTVQNGQQIVRSFNPAPFLVPASERMQLVQDILSEASGAWKALTQQQQNNWHVAAVRLTSNPCYKYNTGGVRDIVPPNRSRTDGRGYFIGCYYQAYVHENFTPEVRDILAQDWDDLVGWTEGGSGTSDINPAGKLRLLPDANNYIQRQKDIGSYPDEFTVEFSQYFDALGTEASGNNSVWEFFGPVKSISFKITTTAILMLKSAGAAYDSFALTTDTGKQYIWRLVIDMAAPSVKVYRRELLTTWSYITEFTDLWTFGAVDGATRPIQFRGVAGDSQSHIDYTYIVAGLYPPVVSLTVPIKEDIPIPPKDFEASCVGGILIVEWAVPEGWDTSKHRVGVWVVGGYSSLGKIFRQWKGYQKEAISLIYSFDRVSVAGATQELLDDLKDTFLYVQLYTCDIMTGLISAGTETIKVLIA